MCICNILTYCVLFILAASNLTHVSASPNRVSDNVGVNITWTPGKFTGPTNYTIQLEEATSLTDNSFKLIETVEVLGKFDSASILYDLYLTLVAKQL